MKRLLVLLLALLARRRPLGQSVVQTDNVRAELLADASAIKPGEPFWVGLRQTIRPKWHTYWKNPGDSGLPTEITWKLPDGRQGRSHRLAAAASLRHQRRHQLRLQGRGHPAGAHHAARQRLGQLASCRRGQLAGVRGRLHPRGRQVRAHPAGDGDRRARATRHARDLRQGAPAACRCKARGRRATALPSRAIRR